MARESKKRRCDELLFKCTFSPSYKQAQKKKKKREGPVYQPLYIYIYIYSKMCVDIDKMGSFLQQRCWQEAWWIMTPTPHKDTSLCVCLLFCWCAASGCCLVLLLSMPAGVSQGRRRRRCCRQKEYPPNATSATARGSAAAGGLSSASPAQVPSPPPPICPSPTQTGPPPGLLGRAGAHTPPPRCNMSRLLVHEVTKKKYTYLLFYLFILLFQFHLLITVSNCPGGGFLV